MKGLIIYKGKYGATQQYANWISEATHWQCYTPENCTPTMINAAGTLVIGSSVYAGRLLLHGWLKHNVHWLQNKQLYFFIVCATPAGKKEVLEQIVRQNIPAELRAHSQVFFLRGRVVINKLNWIDKLMLKLASRATKDPDEKQRMQKGFDAMNKANILPLLQALPFQKATVDM